MVCFLLHMLLEVHLWSQDIPFAGFLLIENALISLLYIFFAWSFIKGKTGTLFKGLHTLFWLIFTGLVIIIRPNETTLEVFNALIPFPQWIALFATGIIMICLSVMDIHQKRKGYDK